jgi:hypothetical protein
LRRGRFRGRGRCGTIRGRSDSLEPLEQVLKVEPPLRNQISGTIQLAALENQLAGLGSELIEVIHHLLALGAILLGQEMEQDRAVVGRMASQVTLGFAIVKHHQKFEFAKHERTTMVSDFLGRLVLP